MKLEEIGYRRMIASVKKEIENSEINLQILRDDYTSYAETETQTPTQLRQLKRMQLQIEQNKIEIALHRLSLEEYESSLKNLTDVECQSTSPILQGVSK